MRIAMQLRPLLLTLWVGSLWTIGYLVAPTLFATLSDKVLAGTIAGSLFRIEAWLSLVCGLALLGMDHLYGHGAYGRQDRQGRQGHYGKGYRLLIIGMLACTLIGYFGLQPFMSALKESAGANGVMASEVRTQFGILHGISSAIFLVQSLLGAALVLRAARQEGGLAGAPGNISR
jgi:hypothetical protein